ncbi:MAG: ABC transporter permease [Geodermatophilaceae bacterium]|nr:ABC transporter permease [Geodermatophilaceae bacterium]
MTASLRLRRFLLLLAAPVLALVISLVAVTLLLLAIGNSPGETFQTMLRTGTQPNAVVDIVNKGTFLYIAALAVAIGFKMNLFNIGVDGQYRLAALIAAGVGGAPGIPGFLRLPLILVAAVLVGAMWAGIAAVLKITRGVNEVLSTIMLNAIATAATAYLLQDGGLGVITGNSIGTRPVPESGWFPSLDPIARPLLGAFGLTPSPSKQVYGFLVVAVLLGIGFWVLVNRTRFGFDLRATGANPSAAVASGINVKRMILVSMLLSGAVAGLVGMPLLLESSGHNYSQNFPTGIGFTGIAVALLGRNSPIGIAFAALLWAYLDVTTAPLALFGISDKLSAIMQALILLAVVVAYEVVRRTTAASEQRRVARELGDDTAPAPTAGVEMSKASRAGMPTDKAESADRPGTADTGTRR